MRQIQPSRRNNVLRVLVLIAAFVVVLSIILLSLNAILPGFADVLEHGDQQELVHYIRDFGSVGGVLLALLLQIVQIISIFFPGGPIQIAIGVVFGTLWGFIICHVGYVLANIAVFFSARRLGNRLDQLFSGNDASESRFRFITESQHPGFVVALACLIPMLPNGLVPYIAARTKITTLQFFFRCIWAAFRRFSCSTPSETNFCTRITSALRFYARCWSSVSRFCTCFESASSRLRIICTTNATHAPPPRRSNPPTQLVIITNDLHSRKRRSFFVIVPAQGRARCSFRFHGRLPRPS